MSSQEKEVKCPDCQAKMRKVTRLHFSGRTRGGVIHDFNYHVNLYQCPKCKTITTGAE